MNIEKNKQTYTSKKVIQFYSRNNDLQKPEETILKMFYDDFKNMKMLDIGVGTGRTTAHFAPYVKEYIGIDFVKEMIEACKKTYNAKFPKFIFQEMDARSLEKFEDYEFDFILFSFNGIDYMTVEERFLTLQKISRILKPEGYFYFSSHNIQSLEYPFEFKLRLNLFAIIKKLIVWQKVKKMNKKQFEGIKTSEYICINDGVHDFGLQTHYFRPSVQQQILSKVGFKNVRFFSLETGLEMNGGDISNSIDRWIYYLCQKN